MLWCEQPPPFFAQNFKMCTKIRLPFCSRTFMCTKMLSKYKKSAAECQQQCRVREKNRPILRKKSDSTSSRPILSLGPQLSNPAPLEPPPSPSKGLASRPLHVPRGCSRNGHAPAECLALVVDGVLTEDECRELVAKRDADARYVREAIREVDGVVYKVPIQNPRR